MSLDQADRALPVAGGGRPVVLGWLAVVLYVASFFLPATDNIPGYQAFVFAVLSPMCLPLWMANPVFWVGLARFEEGRYRAAARAGLFALVLALSECWMFGLLGVGYFAWVGSMSVLAVAGWCGGRESGTRDGTGQLGWPESGEASRIASRFQR